MTTPRTQADVVSSKLPKNMRAIYTEEYGAPDKVLAVKHLPVPQITKPDDVLIKIHAASVHAGDWRLVRASPFIIRLMFGGWFKPSVHVPGCDVSGEISAVGSDVSDIRVGDQVFGDLSGDGFGAFAQYAVVPWQAVVPKPENVPAKHAAASGVSALAALQAVKGADVSGKRVLINGASGGVGTFAVQFAKHYLAAEVVAVCSSKKAGALRSLGATRIIDYTKQDLFQVDDKFDIVIDIACFDSPSKFSNILVKGGKVVIVGGAFPRFLEAMVVSPWMAKTKNISIEVLASKPNQEDLREIAQMLSDGTISPHIDREYSLDQVPEALTFVENRNATGKVVIIVDEGQVQ